MMPSRLKAAVIAGSLWAICVPSARLRGSETPGPSLRGPWDISAPAPTSSGNAAGDMRDPAILLLDFYSTVLNPAISPGCPCFPSCSEYARDAITRFGIIPGTILALERLMHEPGEIEFGRIIRTDRGLRIYDPLSVNTNWLVGTPATR